MILEVDTILAGGFVQRGRLQLGVVLQMLGQILVLGRNPNIQTMDFFLKV